MAPVLMSNSLRHSTGNFLSPVTAEWICDLSVDRYRPMLRLLDDTDLRFLGRQSGFDRDTAGRLRRQRCQIFGGYLTSLSEDFRKICRALRLVMLHAGGHRPDLASALVRKQATFKLYLLRARWHLLLYRWGAGCVDVACLMCLFDSVCVELQGLVPRPDGTLQGRGPYLRLGVE